MTARRSITSPGVAPLLTLKYYEQGREAFEGTFQDVILEDEEPPLVIHAENVLRTMDTTGTGEHNGLVMTTFTPLEGLSETVMHFLPDGQIPEEPVAPGALHRQCDVGRCAAPGRGDQGRLAGAPFPRISAMPAAAAFPSWALGSSIRWPRTIIWSTIVAIPTPLAPCLCPGCRMEPYGSAVGRV